MPLVRFRFQTGEHSPSSLRSSGPSATKIKKKKALRRHDEAIQYYMRYLVYVVECADKSLYVGCTNNLDKRIKQHNDSKWGAHYTKIRRPVTLLYSEQFQTLIEARRREKEIKGWRRDKKLALVLRNSKDLIKK